MASPENPEAEAAAAITTFNGAVARVGESTTTRAGRAARAFTNRRKTSGFALSTFLRPYGDGVSDFTLTRGPRQGDHVFEVPVIPLYPYQLLNRETPVVEADIAKTMALVEQFPFPENVDRVEQAKQDPSWGYQNRWAVVYDRALRVQEEWLAEHPAELPVRIDPKKTDRDEVIKNLLGYGRYYADISKTDFLDALDRVPPGLYPPHVFDSFKTDPLFFIIHRHRAVHSVYADAKELYGEKEFNTLSADERARRCAPLYVQKALDYLPVGASN